MPWSKKWTSLENEALARAWINVSEDHGMPKIKGTNQDQTEFWNEIKEYAPADKPKGTYNEQGHSALKVQWTDKVAWGVKKFNKSLLLVKSSNPTGCNEQNIINMAVAITIGKIDYMSYRLKDLIAEDWILYRAWMILKNHRAFLPPQAPTAESTVDLIEQESSDDGENTVTESSNEAVSERNRDTTTPLRSTTLFAMGTQNVVSSHNEQMRHSRGWTGRGTTKKNCNLEEYRKRKQETLKEQRLKRADLKVFMINQTRVAAFNMAKVMMEACLKMQDMEGAKKYQDQTENIMSHNTEADE
jgi:hypothetical protein